MAVHVADIIKPGVWLEKDPSWPKDAAHDVERWLRALPNELDRCAIALGLFEGARENSAPAREGGERQRDRERIHEGALAAVGVTLSNDEMRLRVETDLRRADWKTGVTPGPYRRILPFMYAELFVGHLYMILKLLKNVSNAAPAHSAKLDAIAARLEGAIGGAKEVRDSHQHRDERFVGKAREKAKIKDIVAQPITTSAIHAPGGGVSVAGGLIDGCFGYTAADGSYANVEVSAAPLAAAQAAVQAALDAFAWKGPREYHPGL